MLGMLQGAMVFGGMDITKPAVQERLKNNFVGCLINCVLSDMAPNATGVKVIDQDKITEMVYEVLKFAVIISAPNANLVVKVWNNRNVAKLEKYLNHFYVNVKRVKPLSSRKDSSEQFLVARCFKGNN